MAAKRKPKLNTELPITMYCWKEENAWFICSSDFTEAPEGTIVGVYNLADVKTVKVTAELV